MPALDASSRNPPRNFAWTLRSPISSCWRRWGCSCFGSSPWPNGCSFPGMYRRGRQYRVSRRGTPPMSDEPRYRAADLVAFAGALFAAAGCDGDKPQLIAELLVEADLMGH